MSQPPSNTRKVITLFWSLAIAVALIALSVGVLMPSTKRAHINFDEDPETDSPPATTRASVEPADRTHIFGSKSAVFEMHTPGATSLPTTEPVR